MARQRSWILWVALVAACTPTQRGDDDQGDDDNPVPSVDASTADAHVDGFIDAGGQAPDGGGMPIAGDGAVFAHSSSVLYRVDPDTYAVTEIGPFVWPTGIFDQMTDIAIDKHGLMTGVSFDKVYRVDPANAACTLLASVARQFNGLSYVPAPADDSDDDDILVGTTTDGSVWRINPMTGATTHAGEYGGGWTSSGDIVSVDGFGTVATVKLQGIGDDFLARIEPDFAAIQIGTGTGVRDLWGLSFWEGKIFGFAASGQLVIIDVTTGVATPQPQGASITWWGAGVSTAAPVIP